MQSKQCENTDKRPETHGLKGRLGASFAKVGQRREEDQDTAGGKRRAKSDKP